MKFLISPEGAQEVKVQVVDGFSNLTHGPSEIAYLDGGLHDHSISIMSAHDILVQSFQHPLEIAILVLFAAALAVSIKWLLLQFNR